MNKENLLSDEKMKSVVLPRKNRISLYFLILLINMFCLSLFGIIPSSDKKLKKYYDLSEKDYGLMNSFIYAGKIIGALSFIFLFKIIRRKILLLVNMFLNCLGAIIMICTKIKYIMYSSMLLMGLGTTFCIIYFPIWCDQYGLKKNKGKFLTFLQISLRFGSPLGQVLTPIFGWKKSIALKAIIEGIIFLIFIFVSEDYFSSKLYSSIEKEEEKNNSDFQSIFKDISQSSDNTQNEFEKVLVKFKSNFLLFTNAIYMLYILGRSFLFFPSTAVSAWEYDFIDETFPDISKEQRTKYLSSIHLSSSIIGMLIGGFSGDLFGSFGSTSSSIICLVSYLCTCIAYQILPHTNTFRSFCISNWIALFCDSIVMPNLTGLIISSVSNTEKPSASSMSSLMSNTLGHMPAPYIYGYLKEEYPDDNRLPLRICCYFSILALLFFTLAAFMKIRANKNKLKVLTKKEEEGKELEDK